MLVSDIEGFFDTIDLMTWDENGFGEISSPWELRALAGWGG